MITAVVSMPVISLTRTRATGYVVVPHLRPTVAIIAAIGFLQATPRYFSRCGQRFVPRHRSLAFIAIMELIAWLISVSTGHYC